MTLRPTLDAGQAGAFGKVLPDWRVQLDGTPLAPGDLSGGLGSVSFTAKAEADSIFLAGKAITSYHLRPDDVSTQLGFLPGYISSCSIQGQQVDVSHTTILNKLHVDRYAPPMGAFGSFIAKYRLRDGNGDFDDTIYATSVASGSDGISGNPFYVGTSAGNIQLFSRDGNFIAGYGNGFNGITAGTADGAYGGIVGGIYAGREPSGSAFYLYASDSTNNRIQRYLITNFGTVITFDSKLGSAGTGNGQFNNPTDIAGNFISGGYVYFVDKGNNRVQYMSNTGAMAYSGQFGSVGTGTSQFTNMTGIATSYGNDNLPYVQVADATSGRIQRFSATGTYFDEIGSIGNSPYEFDTRGQFLKISGITSNITNTFFVRDANGVREYRHYAKGDYEPRYTYSDPLPINTQLITFSVNWGTDGVYGSTKVIDDSGSGITKRMLGPKYGGANLQDLIRAYVALAIDDAQVSTGLSSVYTLVGSWYGDVADKLKELCTIHGFNMQTTSNNITVNQAYATTDTDVTGKIIGTPSLTPSSEGTAQQLQFTLQNNSLPIPQANTNINLMWNDANDWAPYQSNWLRKISRIDQFGVNRNPYVRFSFDGGTESIPAGAQLYQSKPPRAIAGLAYNASLRIRSSKQQRYAIYIKWADNTMSSVSSTGVVTAGTWFSLCATGVAPVSGNFTLIVASEAGSGYAAFTTGDYFDIDGIVVQQTTTTTTLPFFDGYSASSYWLGDPDRSRSVQYEYSVSGTDEIYNALNDDKDRVLSVANGETLDTGYFSIGTFVTDLQQPTVTDHLPIGIGSYYVSDGDGLPITPAEWTFYGGKLQVLINPQDASQIKVIVTAPFDGIPGVNGPFYIGASDGQNRYAQLSVRGQGIRTNPQVVTYYTGADPASTPTILGPLMNSPFHNNYAILHKRIGWALARAAGSQVALSIKTPTSMWSSFGSFTNRTIRYKDSRYRIKSVNVGPITTTLTLERYVTTADFTSRWVGFTTDDIAAAWAAYSIGDMNVAALR